MIKNVVFDIGNVLARFGWQEYMDSFHFSQEAYEIIADATFRSPLWMERDRGVLAEEEILQQFIACAPQYEREITLLAEHIQDWIIEYDYSENLVQELKNAGYRVYYLSNYNRKGFEKAYASYRFFRHMDGGVVSWQEKLVKPGAEIYRCLLDRYHLKAEETLFLDDTLPNIETAENLGFKTVHVTGREALFEGLKNMLGIELKTR